MSQSTMVTVARHFRHLTLDRAGKSLVDERCAHPGHCIRFQKARSATKLIAANVSSV
jgi:hypothetical protein